MQQLWHLAGGESDGLTGGSGPILHAPALSTAWGGALANGAMQATRCCYTGPGVFRGLCGEQAMRAAVEQTASVLRAEALDTWPAGEHGRNRAPDVMTAMTLAKMALGRRLPKHDTPLLNRRRFTNEMAGLRGHCAVAVKAENDDPVVLAGRPTMSAKHRGRIGAQLRYQLWQFAMMPSYENRAVRRALSEPPYEGSDMSISNWLLNRYS